MPPDNPTPSADQLAESEKLRQSGNKAFGQKEFAKAITDYTSAISLNPSSAALYSNRAAAYLSLSRNEQALSDAKRATELSPTWSKAWRRKAAIFNAMGELESARESYNTARELVTSGKDKDAGDVDSAVKDITGLPEKLEVKMKRRREEPNIGTTDDLPSYKIAREVERRVTQEGMPLGAWPPLGSVMKTLFDAEISFEVARSELRKFTEVPAPGNNMPPGATMIFGRLQTLESLTSALIADFRVCRFQYPDDYEKIGLCYKLEQQQRNAVGSQLSVPQTIEVYKKRLRDDPRRWDAVRPALQCTIRHYIMNGIVESSLRPNSQEALDTFRKGIELLEAARRQWTEVSPDDRGKTLQETFLRGVKSVFGEAIMKYLVASGYNSAGSVTETNLALAEQLEELISLGTFLVVSCKREPVPPPHNGVSLTNGEWPNYFAHYLACEAQGHAFLGYANLQLAVGRDKIWLKTADGVKRAKAGNTAQLRRAAEAYARAYALTPHDDPKGALYLWCTIQCMVERGGYYFGDLLFLRELAQTAPAHWSPVWGPNPVNAAHPGKKLAAAAVAGGPADGHPEAICSPYTARPSEAEQDEEGRVPFDEATFHEEVLIPFFDKIVKGEAKDGNGCLLIGEIILKTWEERKARGEPGFVDRMGGLDGKVKSDFETVCKGHHEEMAGRKAKKEEAEKTATPS